MYCLNIKLATNKQLHRLKRNAAKHYLLIIKIRMKDIIELLQKERIKTVDALKHGNQQELPYLQQIDKALGWLKLIEEKGLENVGCYNIHSLPVLPSESAGIYNYYHLMMDYEDPSVENWEEYKPDGQPLLLTFDDIVITRKSR